jgi:hypothetical protein
MSFPLDYLEQANDRVKVRAFDFLESQNKKLVDSLRRIARELDFKFEPDERAYLDTPDILKEFILMKIETLKNRQSENNFV